MSLARPNIARMAGYIPGEQPQRKGFIKLNTNESPYPPSPRVLRALRNTVNADLRLYPDPNAAVLRRKIAETFSTRPECALAGNGSDDILTMIFRAFVGPRRVAAYPVPTYSLYRTLARIENSRTREIPFPPDFSLPKPLFRKGAAVTIVANPNSPTGTAVPAADLARLARAVSGLLVIDEAYADFAQANAMPLALRLPNVLVLRTFSKSYSLCGVRLGFAVGHPAVIAELDKVKDSYNVNRFAIAAGIAALDDIPRMHANAARIIRTRERIAKALESFGWFVYPSQSNFVFARTPGSAVAREVYRQLKRRMILIRYFDEPGLDDGLRISVGSDAEISALLRNLRGILGGILGRRK